MSEHKSVLLHEAIDILAVRDGGIYVDLTLGRAGHSSEILRQIPAGHLFAFDLDDEAIAESRERLATIGNNFSIIHTNFGYAKEALAKLGVDRVDGILADLGVSSPQFDEGDRGFSYRYDAPLDMRMDRNASLTAKVIVNTYSYDELKRIFRDYGEDNDAARVAKKICEVREEKPIETTGELVEIIKKAKPMIALKKKGHPAKQIFQALRIETNHELSMLEKALKELPTILNDGGVFAIISFHSLEDRLVKQHFRALTRIEGSRHDLRPTLEEPDYIDLTKHPILPSEEEREANHRASSAKLRAIRKKEAA